MTDKQIRDAANRIKKARYIDMTDEQKREYAELSCREMINSIMIYGSINSPYNEQEDKLNKYLDDRWQNKKSMFYVPRERIIELVHEQQESFKDAVVKHNVYTDSEGCTYNAILWGDE